MNVKLLIFTFFICVSGIVWSQEDDEIRFDAKVSKNKLGVNERLRIEFNMNKDGDNFVPPEFEGFRILMGPNQSVSHSWINGKRSFSKSYSYVLSPLSKGNFTIKQAAVEIDGETYKTTPVNITVTEAVNDPNAPPSADDIAGENLHLVAEVSNSNPYLNEAVSVVYKLYVSPQINVSNFLPKDNPTYNNFWSQDIKVSRYQVETGLYKGKQYRYVVLKRVVLYPQKTGKLDLEPLSLDVTVDVPTDRRDIFGGRLYTQTHKVVTAGKRTITVKPLPEEGKPAGFTGAVGQFNFDVVTSKTDLKANESLTAKLQVSGSGNLKLFELPKLTLPSSLEVYEPEFEEKISTSLKGMNGRVSDNYTIVPQFKGKYPIPSVVFSYFDPKAEKYKTLSSHQMLVNVYEGPTGASDDVALSGNNAVAKQPVSITGNQFRFIKLDTSLVPKSASIFFGSTGFYILLLVPLLLIPIAIFTGKKRTERANDVVGNRVRKANRLAKKYLSEAKRNLGDKEAFYESLERALHNYLKAKLKIVTSEFSKEKISELLLSKSVEKHVVDEFILLLGSCELARYSPSTSAEMKEDYNKAAQVISLIDKQFSKS
ncbi:BatD family protein [Galbibacter sp. EGI 63066]|uniref:BatD family protein n=1 Tax=Galbibacter sp. EGI 63066 TaxID=2993559 RepID=UPI0022493357|nr:BatD family protein [Galbibacter sp. EGI 63066]MCX2680596.1 BatD family protein [Galbibacter sp. EGI 63066]